MKFLFVLLSLSVSAVFATPSEYWAHASSAVRRARERLIEQSSREQSTRVGLKVRDRNMPTSADYSVDEDPLYCGKPDRETAAGAMWWTAQHCSNASQNLTYAFKSKGVYHVRTAIKGELIKMHCDNWECPIPPVPNCYIDRGVCDSKTEWCMVETHEKWGAWALGSSGHTPDFDHCGDEYHTLIRNATKELDLPLHEIKALHESRNSICQSKTVGVASGYHLVDELADSKGSHTWIPSRGKCVRYRQEGESCIPTESSVGPFSHTFIRRAQTKPGEYAGGGSLDRPLACAPGLVCTGPDFDVLPSTCVKARPRDLCYAGPWWNSTECPRTKKSAPRRGLDATLARRALQVSLLLYPGEVQAPNNCSFWSDAHVEAVRRQGYKIFKALWPEKLVGPYPTYKEVNETFYNISGVNLMAMDTENCRIEDDDDLSPTAEALATASTWSMQPNMVWSLIHFLMHNQPSPMSPKAVEASQALASHLSENFWCNDCRGFFTIGVLSVYGLPPSVTDGEAHARYWNFGHNVASEHVATTRGGHPWINTIAKVQEKGLYNPFFVPYETSVAMWRVEGDDDDFM